VVVEEVVAGVVVVVLVTALEVVVGAPRLELHDASSSTHARDTTSAANRAGPRRRSRAKPEGSRAGRWIIKRSPSGIDPVRPRC
jgi:hypothetical protein